MRKIFTPGLLAVVSLLTMIAHECFADDGVIFGNLNGNKLEAVFQNGSNRQDFLAGTRSVEAIVVDTVRSKIFWSESGAGDIRRIRTANLDGTNVSTIANALSAVDFIFGIDLDSANQKVYWTEYNSDVVRVAGYNGSDVTTLINTGIDGPVGIAVDPIDEKIYFSEAENSRVSVTNLAGGDLTTVYATTPTGPLQLALDTTVTPKQLYYLQFSSLERVDIDGGSPTTIVSSGIGIGSALTIDSVNRRAFIGDVGNYKIHKVDLDGNNFTSILSNVMSVFGIALSDVQAVPTPTVVPTASPTVTALPTLTPTLVPTTQATVPAPLPSATPVSSATPVPTQTSTPIPVATSNGTNVISGTLTDADGRPIAQALVSLFESVVTDSGFSAQSTGKLIKTTSTNPYGEYRFTNLSSGLFVMQPRLDGVTFSPATLTLSTGTQAAPILGKAEPANALCTKKNVVTTVVKFADAAEALKSAGDQTFDRLLSVIGKSKSSIKKNVLPKIAKLRLTAQTAQSQLLNLNSELPLVVITCPKKVCLEESFVGKISSIKARLRRILIQSQKASGLTGELSSSVQGSTASNVRRSIARYVKALDQANKLPLKSANCS